MNKTEKLLPCPFCGQQPTEYAIEPHTHALQFSGGKMPDHQGSHVIECACGCGIIDATREEVFSVWNRRPTPCLHLIQGAAPVLAAPAAVAVPDAVRDALLQSEAALEVAIARILKSDPGHSISVTSEAKALVAVRAAIAATTAAAPVLPEPDFLQRHEDVCGDEVGPPTAFYTADTVRALLATGGQVREELPQAEGADYFVILDPEDGTVEFAQRAAAQNKGE